MVPQNFAVLKKLKLGFCSKCSQNFSGCSFSPAHIFRAGNKEKQIDRCFFCEGASDKDLTT